MKHISVINSIEVPEGMEEEAIRVRDEYIDYFSKQPGFVSSTFYKSINSENRFNFINMVVWDSYESYMAVVNSGAFNSKGVNEDGMKVLGQGFPSPITITPGQYKTISK